jgi:hypothetical protein
MRVILFNPIYRGMLVWNRSEWIKDHETKRRRRYERPEAEWIRREAPELRIISDEIGAAVAVEQRRRAAPYVRTADGRRLATHTARTAPRKHLLAGFLECGVCGGSFHALSRPERYGCAWHRTRGPSVCASTLAVRRTALEGAVLSAIRKEVLSPDTVTYIVEMAFAALAAHEQMRQANPSRLREIDHELANLVRLAAATGDIPEVASAITALKAEAAALRLAARPGTLVTKALRRRIIEETLQLRAAFDAAPDEARTALRALLRERRMRVAADQERGWRVEGLFEVPLIGRAQALGPGPDGGNEVVAGGRYNRVAHAFPDGGIPLRCAS